MFGSIFNPENFFWKRMSNFADVLVLSLLWLVCSIPVFTVGAATAALYDAASRCVRGGENGPWSRFFHTFRREFFTSAVVTVAWGVLLVVLGVPLRLLWAAAAAGAVAGPAGVPVAAACTLVYLLVPVGAALWMFPLLSRFTFRPVGLMLAGLQFAVGYLPYTLAAVFIAAAAALAAGLMFPAVLVLPCLTALLWSLVMERAFRRYMSDEDAPPPDGEEP